jgi:hypothetical protein
MAVTQQARLGMTVVSSANRVGRKGLQDWAVVKLPVPTPKGDQEKGMKVGRNANQIQ